MARPRVLITGFGSFPGVTDNPSAWLAESLAERQHARAFRLDVRVLPAEWEVVARLPLLYRELKPRVMIHFGLDERATAFRIERSAHNRAAPCADARGAMPNGFAIRADGPERLDTPFPAAKLAAHLRRSGVATVTSRFAGAYLCNFLYYQSLDWASGQRSVPSVIFVHVPPWTGKRGPFSREALLNGAKQALRFVLGYANGQKPLKTRARPPMSRSEIGVGAKGA